MKTTWSDAQWFIETATSFARERHVFDRPIGRNQGIQFPITSSWPTSPSTCSACRDPTDGSGPDMVPDGRGLHQPAIALIWPLRNPADFRKLPNTTMKRVSAEEMRSGFLTWQCRIRQIAMREHGGRPTPGMRPRVLRPSGECLLEAMTVLILHDDPEESTAFFRFQVQKSPDPLKVYQSVLGHLQREYYQMSDRFSDELTALFEPQSPSAAKLVKARRCLLEFEQFSQVWRLSCAVRRLPPQAPAREATLWHNRAFNPAIPKDAEVLGFKPAWRSASASSLPRGN